MQIAKADIFKEISGGGVDLAALITLMHARHHARHPTAAPAGVAGAPVAVTSPGTPVAATSPGTATTATAVRNADSSMEPANHYASGAVAPAKASFVQEESSLTTAIGASGSLSTANTTTNGQSQLQQPLQDAMDRKGEGFIRLSKFVVHLLQLVGRTVHTLLQWCAITSVHSLCNKIRLLPPGSLHCFACSDLLSVLRFAMPPRKISNIKLANQTCQFNQSKDFFQ